MAFHIDIWETNAFKWKILHMVKIVFLFFLFLFLFCFFFFVKKVEGHLFEGGHLLHILQ